MWKLKSCPRCGGDIFIDLDQETWYEQCLQCGYRCDLPDIIELREKVGMLNGKTDSLKKVSMDRAG